ncbi:MAG: DUF2116 family Zn-ribbon domain-containing protein [Ruminococcaceae bacterium]|nr:DUF2116 family Zn-ribbon domain-containing protein [Oscillospiraceae bacterium]
MNDNSNFQNEFPNEMPHCPRCGAPINTGAAFCGNCGLQFEKVQKSAIDTLSVWDYILMMVIFSLPVVGLVLMLYWGFGSQVAINRKNFARAYLIFYVISMVLSFVMLGALGSLTSTVFESGTASLF